MSTQEEIDLPPELQAPDNPDRVPEVPDIGVEEGETVEHEDLGVCFVHRVRTQFINTEQMYVKVYEYPMEESEEGKIHKLRGTPEHFTDVFSEYEPPTTIKQIKDLEEYDLLDLEGDEYADPDGDTPILEFELAVVIDTERETADCIRVDTNHGSFGFPPDHEVEVTEHPPA